MVSVGDRFPVDELNDGDCPAVYRGEGGMIAPCALGIGHDGEHIAICYEDVVVRVWSGDDS